MTDKEPLKIGSLTIKPRLTVKHLRRLKTEGGIDLATKNPDPMLDFLADPINTGFVAYYLYQDQIEAAKVEEDDFYDLLDAETIEAVRAEVDQQMRSFSTFWKMVSTEMEGLLSGDSDLKSLVAKGMQERQMVPSGHSS